MTCQTAIQAIQQKSTATPFSSGLLLRQCACGNHTMCGECVECSKKKQTLQRTPLSSRGRGTEGEGKVPPIVHEVLRSPGQPLDPGIRAFFEPRFRHDFSQVRVHTNAKAAESAEAVNALAYTVGQSVVFGTRQYAPSTYEGRSLMAHELTHVVQQGSAGIRIGSQDDPAEREARGASEHVLRGNVPPFSAAVHTTHDKAQRQVAEDEEEDEDERHRIPVVTESHSTILRQQGTPPVTDLPPPRPVPPHYTQILSSGDVLQTIADCDGVTCKDRCERGFWIFWNVATKTAYPGDIVIGNPAPEKCEKRPHIDLGPMPPDPRDGLVAGWFHNHPPRPGCVLKKVGPGKEDIDISSRFKLPGLLQDFIRPGANTTCKDNPRGTYWFGPVRREK